MVFPDRIKVFTTPLVADEGGGQSPGVAAGLYRDHPARISVLSAADAHIEVGVGNARLWRLMLPPSVLIQYPAQTYYVSLQTQSISPLLLADRCYEVIKARHQRRGTGPVHHTSLVVKEAAISDPTVLDFADAIDVTARWAVELTYTAGTVLEIPSRVVHPLDYVKLEVEHGNQRSLPQYLGRDFVTTVEGALDITNVLDLFEVGYTVWIVNYGQRPGIKWTETRTFTGNPQALTNSFGASDLLELGVTSGAVKSLTYYSGRDFEATSPNSLDLSGISVDPGDVIDITNFGSVQQ